MCPIATVSAPADQRAFCVSSAELLFENFVQKPMQIGDRRRTGELGLGRVWVLCRSGCELRNGNLWGRRRMRVLWHHEAIPRSRTSSRRVKALRLERADDQGDTYYRHTCNYVRVEAERRAGAHREASAAVLSAAFPDLLAHVYDPVWSRRSRSLHGLSDLGLPEETADMQSELGAPKPPWRRHDQGERVAVEVRPCNMDRRSLAAGRGCNSRAMPGHVPGDAEASCRSAPASPATRCCMSRASCRPTVARSTTRAGPQPGEPLHVEHVQPHQRRARRLDALTPLSTPAHPTGSRVLFASRSLRRDRAVTRAAAIAGRW